MDTNRKTDAAAEWESPATLGRRTGLPADTWRLWARLGKVPARRVGNLILFNRAEVDSWLSGQPSAADVIPRKKRGTP